MTTTIKCDLDEQLNKHYEGLRTGQEALVDVKNGLLLNDMLTIYAVNEVPKEAEGVVVECGSYKGGSTANLSLVCDSCNRELEVFDSFEGLPEPSHSDKTHFAINTEETHNYLKGDFSADLEEVKENIRRYGRINICNFHKGFFDKTLPLFDKKVAFIFLDVDLKKSLEDCLKYLWPKLQDNCRLYTHEASHREMVSLFFDREWWLSNLYCEAPGLVGGGTGLGLAPAKDGYKSSLAFTIKNPQVSGYKKAVQEEKKKIC